MHEQPGGANRSTESNRANTRYGNGRQDSPNTHGQPNNSSISRKQEKAHKNYRTNQKKMKWNSTNAAQNSPG